MHIDSYEFGRIVVDGRAFSQDIILLPDGIQDSWWRLEGHRLQIPDVAASLGCQTGGAHCGQRAAGQNAGGCSPGPVSARKPD